MIPRGPGNIVIEVADSGTGLATLVDNQAGSELSLKIIRRRTACLATDEGILAVIEPTSKKLRRQGLIR